nr:hypothetical protein [Pandoravirus belohorizontensis]
MALCDPPPTPSLQRQPATQVKHRIVELLDQLNRDGERPTRKYVARLCRWSGLTVDECIGAIDEVLVEQERLVRQAQRAYAQAKRDAAAERAADPCVLFQSRTRRHGHQLSGLPIFKKKCICGCLLSAT